MDAVSLSVPSIMSKPHHPPYRLWLRSKTWASHLILLPLPPWWMVCLVSLEYKGFTFGFSAYLVSIHQCLMMIYVLYFPIDNNYFFSGGEGWGEVGTKTLVFD